MARVTVLDASVLISHFGGDKHSARAGELIAEADELAASTITLAELLVGAERARRLTAFQRRLDDLEIEEVPLRSGAAPALARLRVRTGLPLPDCCVLHAANELRDQGSQVAIATFDRKLARAAAA
jgi:predicted nucleic acid-binding protein